MVEGTGQLEPPSPFLQIIMVFRNDLVAKKEARNAWLFDFPIELFTLILHSL